MVFKLSTYLLSVLIFGSVAYGSDIENRSEVKSMKVKLVKLTTIEIEPVIEDQKKKTSEINTLAGLIQKTFPTTNTKDLVNNAKNQFQIVPVLVQLSAIRKKDDPNKVVGFKAAALELIDDTGTPDDWKETQLPNAFILPDGRAIPLILHKMVFSPTSVPSWTDSDTLEFFAYRLSTTGSAESDRIRETAYGMIRECLMGDYREGLSYYFTDKSPNFEGYDVFPGISTDDEKQKQFLNSVEISFRKYSNSVLSPDMKTCDRVNEKVHSLVLMAGYLVGIRAPTITEILVK